MSHIRRKSFKWLTLSNARLASNAAMKTLLPLVFIKRIITESGKLPVISLGWSNDFADLARRLSTPVKIVLHDTHKRRVHMTIGMTTGLQTGLPTDRRYVYTERLVCIPVCIPVCKPGFKTLFTYLATPTCMFTTPYLQPADGRGQHVLIYIRIYTLWFKKKRANFGGL